MWLSVFPNNLLKRLYYFFCIFLATLSNTSWLYIDGFIYGLSILFYWSMCLFQGSYHTVLIEFCNTVWNQEVWCLQLSQDCHGYSGSFVVPSGFQNCLFCFCEKYHSSFYRDCTKSTGSRLWVIWNLNGINSSNSQTWIFYLFVHSFIFFINILYFSVYRFFSPPWLNCFSIL